MKDLKTRKVGYVTEIHVVDDCWISMECLHDLKGNYCNVRESILDSIENEHGKKARDSALKIIEG